MRPESPITNHESRVTSYESPAPSHQSRVTSHDSRAPDRILFYAFLALLVWLPLPLASYRPWAWSLMEVWVYAIAAIWLWQYANDRVFVTQTFRKASPVLILLALWLVYGLIHIAPLPSQWIEILSPRTTALYDQSIPVTNQESRITSHLSLDRHVSMDAWFRSVAYVLIFALGLLLGNSRRRLETLAYVLIFSGVAQAVYGSLMTLSGLEYGFLQKKAFNAGVATGTFVNPNHFAAFLVMTLSIGIGLLLAKMKPRGEHLSLRQRLRSLAELLLGSKARLRVYLVIMVIALILSRSRMGNAEFLFSMLIAGAMALVLFRRAPRPAVVLIASLIVIDIAILGAWFGIERIGAEIQEEFQASTLNPDNRHEVRASAFNLWRDYPLFGTGLGSFYGTFPAYREGGSYGFNYHAENDYYQMLTEGGVIGFGLLAAVVALSLVSALRAQRERTDPLMRGFGFAATMGIIAILIHSTIAFNLQIPANTALFMVLLAFAWHALYLGRRSYLLELPTTST